MKIRLLTVAVRSVYDRHGLGTFRSLERVK